jgi:hypothetical protein
MKKSYLVALLVLFVSYTSYSQELEMSFDKATSDYAVDLIKKGVPMVYVYEAIYKDKTQTPDYYVIWRDEKGNDYLHKNTEKEVVVLTKEDLNNFWEFVTANFQTIMTEPVMEFTYVVGKQHYSLENENEGHLYFKAFLNGETAQKWMNNHDFFADATVKGKKVANVWFEDNQKLLAKRSADMVQEMLLRIKK